MKNNHIKYIGDYVRYLTLMSIERAKSGHPGMPLGCADVGSLLYSEFLKFNNENTQWENRDRFILSNGHGSMLLYALNYIFCYQDYVIDDFLDFRKFNSILTAHPEYDLTRGIEVTTGQLGQGIANAVGIALGGKLLANKFNTNEFNLFDFNVYTIVGDGCMMEGITNEAVSLAGSLKLDNLIMIYDSNQMTIDGLTNNIFDENIKAKYEALNWEVQETSDDISNIRKKLTKLLETTSEKPKLLIVETTIGEGLDKLKNTRQIHGFPPGKKEIEYFLYNSVLNINVDVAEQIKTGNFHTRDVGLVADTLKRNKQKYNEWLDLFNLYKIKESEKYKELTTKKLSNNLVAELLNYTNKPDAGRNISADILQLCSKYISNLIVGSADLAYSTKAVIQNENFINVDTNAKNISYGAREHAMAGIGNGLAVTGFTPVSSTYLIFSDYMKPAIRMASLMGLKHLFYFTHDSFYIGSDGITHVPIEQLNSLRLIPNLNVFRPANDIEIAYSYLYFLENSLPTVIITSRQKLNDLVFDIDIDYNDFKKGGYVFSDADNPDIILAGSGTEIGLLMEVKKQLKHKSIKIVSIPNMKIFDEQTNEYKDTVFNKNIPVVFIEPASHLKGFYRDNINVIDIEKYGPSGDPESLAEYFGFTVDNLTDKILTIC